MIRFDGRDWTPTQLAKELVSDGMERAYYWNEQYAEDDVAKVTQREADLIGAAVDKQVHRVRRFLGLAS